METLLAGTQRNARTRLPLPGLLLLLPRQPVRASSEDDGQCKKKTGTATMHESSSRPFARRERKCGWAENCQCRRSSLQGFKVSEVSKFQSPKSKSRLNGCLTTLKLTL